MVSYVKAREALGGRVGGCNEIGIEKASPFVKNTEKGQVSEAFMASV